MSYEDDKAFKDWARHVRESTVRGMSDSAFVTSLSPDAEDDIDIKFAVETGLAILMDKPLIVIATGDRVVPPGLRRVAHVILEVEDMDTEAGRTELMDRLQPILENSPEDFKRAVMDGAERIAAERRRQVEVEGYTVEHDVDHHGHGELLEAALAYIEWLPEEWQDPDTVRDVERRWPFPDGWKPSSDPVRNLEKAGALIAAEIDRLLTWGGG